MIHFGNLRQLTKRTGSYGGEKERLEKEAFGDKDDSGWLESDPASQKKAVTPNRPVCTMNKTIRSLQRGVKAGVKAASEPINTQSKYKSAGQHVRCSQCGSEVFEPGPPFAGTFSGPVL